MLDGAIHFISWKTRILLILEENYIKNYVKEIISKPGDVGEKSKHKKNEAKAKRNMIESFKDHLIPYVVELKTAKEMFDALAVLFKSKNTSKNETSNSLYHDF